MSEAEEKTDDKKAAIVKKSSGKVDIIAPFVDTFSAFHIHCSLRITITTMARRNGSFL